MKKKAITQYEDAVRDVLRKLENSSKLLNNYFFKTGMEFYNSREWWAKEVQTQLIHQIETDIRLLSKGVDGYDSWKRMVVEKHDYHGLLPPEREHDDDGYRLL